MLSCKICDSDKKEIVETMILKGETNSAIAKTLQSFGFDISHATVNRHKNKHMPEHIDKIRELATPKTNVKHSRINTIYVNDDEINKRIIEELDKCDFNKIISTYNEFTVMLNRIAKNQLTVVLDTQEKYMKGECKYPNEQIRGLQIIKGILIDFEKFQKDTYEYLRETFDKRLKFFESNTNDLHFDIEKLGAEMKEKRKYIKGDIFRIIRECDYDIDFADECYWNMYIPACNLSFRQQEEFFKGVDKKTGEVEKNDVRIKDGILVLDDEEFEKTVNKLATGNYEQVQLLKKFCE